MASMMNQISVDDRAAAAACDPSKGLSWCGGCIRDCRLTTKMTCNGWIDKECNQGCAGEGAFAVNGQCCPNTGLIQCNNGRCGYAGPQCNPATNQQGASATGTTTNQTANTYAGKKLNSAACNQDSECLSGKCVAAAPNAKFCSGSYPLNCDSRGGHDYCNKFFSGTYCAKQAPNSSVFSCVSQRSSGSCVITNNAGSPLGDDWRKVCADWTVCNQRTGQCESLNDVPQTNTPKPTGEQPTKQNTLLLNCHLKGGHDYCQVNLPGSYCARSSSTKIGVLSTCVAQGRQDYKCRMDDGMTALGVMGGDASKACAAGYFCSDSQRCKEKYFPGRGCRFNHQCKSNQCNSSGMCD